MQDHWPQADGTAVALKTNMRGFLVVISNILIVSAFLVPVWGHALTDSLPFRARDWFCTQVLNGSENDSKILVSMLSTMRAEASVEVSDESSVYELLRSARYFKPNDRERVLTEVRSHYEEARLVNKGLRRIYDFVLKFTLPESTDFGGRAARVGPERAYSDYLAAVAKFHKGALEIWHEEKIRKMAKTFQALMKAASPQNQKDIELIIAGSVPNGHGDAYSDLDSISWPIHILHHEPGIVAATRKDRSGASVKYIDLLADDFRIPREKPDYQRRWQNLGIMNLNQPFALRIRPNTIELIHFLPRIGWISSKTEFNIYKLDW